MKNQITSRDIERLSAYLDNQLDGKERARLEERLIVDQELRRDLQELENTRLLLRDLPRLRAPRNFMIRPETISKPVGVQPSFKLFPTYGVVSAIATILLVMVIFADRLISSTAPAALAPAEVASVESVVVQQEVGRSEAPTSSAEEAAPMAMMEAPVLTSPLPPEIVAKAAESGIATPTTIFLNALPPSMTPEDLISIMSGQTVTSTIACEGNFISGDSQRTPNLSLCTTPTGTPSNSLLGLQSTDVPISSPVTPYPSMTPLPTDTPYPTATPIPTSTSTLIPSPTLVPTHTPVITEDIPTGSIIEAPVIPAPSDQLMDTTVSTPTDSESGEIANKSPNFEFVKYIILTIELSLASIAAIAGILAILMRLRAGR
jgi:hypothetical protein